MHMHHGHGGRGHAAQAGTRPIFANRFIPSILLSGLLLQMGIWIRNFAILLFVTEQTDKDPVAISLISVAEFGPIFLFSFIGGAFADRWRPKLTMVVSDLLSAASVFVVLLTLVYGSWQAVFFATLVSSILSQFSQPSAMRLFKQHVPESQMQQAMSMYQTVMAMFTVLGPMLGTLVYFEFGIQAAIAIMGICFLLSAAVLAFLPADRKQETDAGPKAGLGSEMKLGFRYVTHNKLFLYMGGFFLMGGLGMGLVNPLGIFLVTENLGLKEDMLQWFTAANGVGMVIGGIGAMALSGKLSPHAMLMTGFLGAAASVAAVGSVDSAAVALAFQFAAGLMAPLIHIAINTLILNNAEEAFVGRVNGILNPIFTGAMVVNMSIVGLLKAQIPLTSLYLLAAAFYVIGAIGMLPMLKLGRVSRPAKASAHAMHHH